MPTPTRRRDPEYKQMAFETAVRNPDRYLGVLSAIKEFEGRILSDEFLLDLVTKLYLEGEFSSDEIEITNTTKAEDIKEKVIAVNSTRNADGGFPKGYCSRFWTYMRTLSELGLVYARYNESLKISEIGHKFVNGEIDEQEAFSIQAAKYNRRSPYRNVSNDYNFFRLAIDTILYLKERGKRMSYEQFIVLMFNKSGDITETINILENNVFPDERTVYAFVSKHYGNTNSEGTVLKDYPDVVRRVMIIAGFITVRYEGKKFIEINENKRDYIENLMSIKFTLSEAEKTDPEKYFAKLDTPNAVYLALVEKYRKIDSIEGGEYTTKLQILIDEYKIDEDKVIKSINEIEKGSDAIEEFKEIPAPLKLEFYISIFVALKYKGVFFVKPNYKADHRGKPYSHAPGNMGDIHVYSDKQFWLIEVTLIRNKTQQLNSETTTIIRHLNSDEELSNYHDKYLSLVAPIVHPDTRSYLEFELMRSQQEGKRINGKPYNLDEFIEVTARVNNLTDMEEYTNNISEHFKAAVLNRKKSD